MVAELGDIEIVFADSGPDGGNHGSDFVMAQHLVVAGLLYVEDLTLEGKNRLEAAIAAGFRGAACRLTLYQIHFTTLRIFLLAIGELSR